MAIWLTIALAAAALNVILLAGLNVVWIRNYAKFRSKHTLGLALFGVSLLVENALALYVFVFHPVVSAWMASSAPVAQTAMMALRVLELLAVVVLAWVTFD